MSEFYTNVAQLGNHILVRGIDDNGSRFESRVPFEPYLFISTNEDSDYHDIHGRSVKRRDFHTPKEAREFIAMYKDVEGIDIYGFDRWPYVYIYDHYKELDPDTSKINIVCIDIEVAHENQGFPRPEDALFPLTTIALRRGDLRLIFGYKEYTPKQKNTYYIQCKNEHDLISKFLSSWEKLDVDVLTGWNTEFFDIPYLVNRITMISGHDQAKRLSPWGKLQPYTVKYGTQKNEGYNIIGISCLDYLAVYKKFRLQPRESYRLDYIASYELGEQKLDYSEYKNLRDLYERDFERFVDYNIRDTDLVLELDEKLGYLNQIFMISYDAGTNFNDSLSTLLNWDSIIHRYLRDKNTVVPISPSIHGHHHIEGGYVKPPHIGMHKWVMSFDLNSLYPSIIRGSNISPDVWIRDKSDLNELKFQCNVDSLLDKKIDTTILEDYNVAMTANGNFFSHEKQGFMAALVESMYAKRVDFKNKMIQTKKEYQETGDPILKEQAGKFHNIQHATKILLNSLYGAMASKYFRWFELEHAEGITMTGQLAIRWVERDINRYLNKILGTKEKDYVLAIDTDSVYVCFDDLVKKVYEDDSDVQAIVSFLDKVAETKIEPVIDESYQNLADYLNSYEQQMVMKRENIANLSIWTAKKRYIMNVYDSEGFRYEEPELKMMGIEAIRSSTPSVCRAYIKNTLKLIMKGDEEATQKYIAQAKEEFFTLSFEEVAFPRSISFTGNSTNADGTTSTRTYEDKNTIYKKGTPIQVKGALIYNHLIDKFNLQNDYEKISDGEKIKFAYLKKPNPIQQSVISAVNDIPKEFGLHKYIGYETQFEKGFIKPITTILEVIGWTSEKKSTLMDFFA